MEGGRRNGKAGTATGPQGPRPPALLSLQCNNCFFSLQVLIVLVIKLLSY